LCSPANDGIVRIGGEYFVLSTKVLAADAHDAIDFAGEHKLRTRRRWPDSRLGPRKSSQCDDLKLSVA